MRVLVTGATGFVELRDVTERPETIECGSNILSGGTRAGVVKALEIALGLGTDWTPPSDYVALGVARTVVKIVLGYTSVRHHSSENGG